MRIASFCTLLLLAAAGVSAQDAGIEAWLRHSVIDPQQPLVEVQVYEAARVPRIPTFRSADEWEKYATDLRARILRETILRGEAARWNEAAARVEWVETFAGGPGYHVRKLRYEVIPGLWAPALLYEPDKLAGKVPAVLNVNGHEGNGTANSYIQERCINLAKRGMLALNLEWLGKGQLDTPGFQHSKINQIDLCGTSGVALHYLAMKRAIDLLLAHEHADAARLAVTGLSGGGWQTILISSLDTRVKLSDPVAGYSSFLTRAQFDQDLGDSEQSLSDLGPAADYTHLTALLAPRPSLLTYNAKDSCCFRADHAVAPLLNAVRPVFALYGAEDRLRYHLNHDAGHNYGRDNREAFYRMLRDFFYGGKLDAAEIPSEAEIKKAEQLRMELPADNKDFHSIALELSKSLPRSMRMPPAESREKLSRLVRYQRLPVEAREAGGEEQARYWRLVMDGAWTVPAVEIAPASASSTVLVLADQGRAAAAPEVKRLVAEGRRVVAVDPFYFGESKIATRKDFIYVLQMAALGERALGLQASQVAAAARWLEGERRTGPVEVVAIGPRTSLIALVASAIETRAIAGVTVQESFKSLKEAIERDLTANTHPEIFCFGLLEAFDIPQIAELAAPRPVRFQ